MSRLMMKKKKNPNSTWMLMLQILVYKESSYTKVIQLTVLSQILLEDALLMTTWLKNWKTFFNNKLTAC